MQKLKAELSIQEEMLVLQFWALGVDIAKTFGPGRIALFPVLAEALRVTSKLPVEIGWDDDGLLENQG